MQTSTPKTRYAETKLRVKAHATERGLRMSRNKIEQAAKHLMALEDGVFTDMGPCQLTYQDTTGEKATGRSVLWMDELLRELVA